MDSSLDADIIPLDDCQVPNEFNCDDVPLTNFLLKQAKLKHEIKESFVYLAVHDDDVVGYVALAAATVRDKELKRPIPAVLIARLAVQEEFKKCGLGKKLVLWSLTQAYQVSKRIACRYVYADVLEDSKAEGFYGHLGFDKMKGSRYKAKEYTDQYLNVLYIDLNKYNLPES